MTTEERTELNWFKDRWVRNQHPELENWGEYLSYCRGNGFDETEIGYDRLMVDFANFRIDTLLSGGK